MMWWLLACALPPDGGDDDTTPTADGVLVTGTDTVPWDSAVTTPTAFTFGEVRRCEAPVEAAWAEALPSEFYGNPESGAAVATEPGGVAVLGDRLYWVAPTAEVRSMGLHDGEVRVEPWGAGGVAGISLADLDGDGSMDMALSGYLPTLVWGVGTDGESETALPPGDQDRWVRDISPGDLDGDGVVDLVLSYTGLPVDRSGLGSEVWRGTGGRTFAAAAPIEVEGTYWGHTFDSSLIDLDGDADLDLYICNDLGAHAPNGVLLNDGQGGFAPGGEGWGLDIALNCMGAAWGDVDADGTLDVYLSDTFRHWLLVDEGSTWVDEAAARGLGGFPPGGMAWGAALVDADNDGATDLLSTLSDFHVAGAGRYPTALFLQQSDGTFKAATLPSEVAAGRGVVATDLNEDGVVDFVVGDASRSPWVMVSQGCTEAEWVDIVAPPGSLVIVEADGVTHVQPVTTEAGFASAGPARAHIGLGRSTFVDRVLLLPLGGGPVLLPGPVEARRTITWSPP